LIRSSFRIPRTGKTQEREPDFPILSRAKLIEWLFVPRGRPGGPTCRLAILGWAPRRLPFVAGGFFLWAATSGFALHFGPWATAIADDTESAIMFAKEKTQHALFNSDGISQQALRDKARNEGATFQFSTSPAALSNTTLRPHPSAMRFSSTWCFRSNAQHENHSRHSS